MKIIDTQYDGERIDVGVAGRDVTISFDLGGDHYTDLTPKQARRLAKALRKAAGRVDPRD